MTSLEKLDLSKAVFAKLEAVAPQIKHYFGILSLLGALKTAEVNNDTEYLKKITDYLQKFPDEIEHNRYTFKSYYIGGIARAYALFKGYMTDDRTKQLVREYAEELMYEAPRDRNGIVKSPYISPREVIWIDNAMAVTPYLLYSGLALNEPAYIDEAVKQTIMMYDVFRDPATGLLHQTKGEIAAGVMTDDFWGRGNGWGYIALTELLQYLPAEHPERWKVEEYFGQHSYAMLKCQTINHVWRQQMDDPSAYEEATATGLILYGYGVGLRLDYLNRTCFARPYQDGVEAMCYRFINENMDIVNVCPGCRTPGFGAEQGSRTAYSTWMPVTNDLHAFAPLQLALAEAAIECDAKNWRVPAGKGW